MKKTRLPHGFYKATFVKAEGNSSLGPRQTTIQVYLEPVDIQVNVNVQDRSVNIILEALLNLRFEVEICVGFA